MYTNGYTKIVNIYIYLWIVRFIDFSPREGYVILLCRLIRNQALIPFTKSIESHNQLVSAAEYILNCRKRRDISVQILYAFSV